MASLVNSVDPDQLASEEVYPRCFQCKMELVIINQNMKYRFVLT